MSASNEQQEATLCELSVDERVARELGRWRAHRERALRLGVQSTARVPCAEAGLFDCALASDGARVAVWSSSHLEVVDLATLDASRGTLSRDTRPARVAFQDAATLVVLTRELAIVRCRVSAGLVEPTGRTDLSVRPGRSDPVMLSADGRSVILRSGDRLLWLDTETGSLVREIDSEKRWDLHPDSATFSPDGRFFLFARSALGGLYAYGRDGSSTRLVASLVAFSDDGRAAARLTGADFERLLQNTMPALARAVPMPRPALRVGDGATLATERWASRALPYAESDLASATQLRLSHDGRLLAVVRVPLSTRQSDSADVIEVLDTTNGARVATLDGRTSGQVPGGFAGCSSLAFSRDGARLCVLALARPAPWRERTAMLLVFSVPDARLLGTIAQSAEQRLLAMTPSGVHAWLDAPSAARERVPDASRSHPLMQRALAAELLWGVPFENAADDATRDRVEDLAARLEVVSTLRRLGSIGPNEDTSELVAVCAGATHLMPCMLESEAPPAERGRQRLVPGGGGPFPDLPRVVEDFRRRSPQELDAAFDRTLVIVERWARADHALEQEQRAALAAQQAAHAAKERAQRAAVDAPQIERSRARIARERRASRGFALMVFGAGLAVIWVVALGMFQGASVHYVGWGLSVAWTLVKGGRARMRRAS